MRKKCLQNLEKLTQDTATFNAEKTLTNNGDRRSLLVVTQESKRVMKEDGDERNTSSKSLVTTEDMEIQLRTACDGEKSLKPPSSIEIVDKDTYEARWNP